MTRFLSTKNRTPEYEQAVEALRALIDTEKPYGSLDVANRAYAEAVSEPLKAVWAKSRGLKQSQATVCARRLVGKKCTRSHTRGNCLPTCADHNTLWLKDGKAHSVVTQPYGLTWEKLVELVSFCKALGIEAQVDAGMAWHFPGSTLMVTLTRT